MSSFSGNREALLLGASLTKPLIQLAMVCPQTFPGWRLGPQCNSIEKYFERCDLVEEEWVMTPPPPWRTAVLVSKSGLGLTGADQFL
jgi:hypothetical protein